MWRARHNRLSATPIPIGLALGLCLVGEAHPQELGEVTGTVLTTILSGQREPVPGVMVGIPGLQLSTLSDDDGRFSLTAVSAGSREIRTELIGCLLDTRTIRVLPDTTVNVEILVRQRSMRISGLVVDPVALRPPEVEQAYSSETIELDEERGRRSIASIIRGAFPGVRVLSQSGLAGEEISIQLRGPSSITGGGQPLVVVDGIITSGGVIDLNPSDVAAVRVLKGAGAAAEYGARGAAGVIEITTRGIEQEPTDAPGPIVVIDGVVSEAGLSGIDTDEIVRTQLLTGAQARVLLGSAGHGAGVLWITTDRPPPSAEEAVDDGCVPAPR